MPKTVEDVLRESGLTDEQIKAIDQKAMQGLTTYAQSANQSLEAAELAKRAQSDLYEKEIAPALDNWTKEKADKDARMAAYEAALKSAADSGFQVPPILANRTPSPERNPAGQFVAGANAVPGSPQYMSRDEGYAALSSIQYLNHEYMRLHNGAPPPDDLDVLAREAGQQHMSLKDWASKKYQFNEKREALKLAEQKKRDDALVKDTEDRIRKEYAEKFGNNPEIRSPQTSQFSTINKGVKEGQRPDPLKMNRDERRTATRQQIGKEIAEHDAQRVN
jgi:hypothetical protein